MRTYFAAVLGVIAVGVMLIAYGLLSPRVGAAPGDIVTLDSRGAAYQTARPVYASERVAAPGDPYVDARDPRAYPAYVPPSAGPVYAPPSARPVYASQAPVAPRRTVTHPVINDGAPRRDWKKTALVIGGSTAAGAGLGGIFGGKKGALIGAAIGGGGSTLWEAMHK